MTTTIDATYQTNLDRLAESENERMLELFTQGQLAAAPGELTRSATLRIVSGWMATYAERLGEITPPEAAAQAHAELADAYTASSAMFARLAEQEGVDDLDEQGEAELYAAQPESEALDAAADTLRGLGYELDEQGDDDEFSDVDLLGEQ